MAEDILPNRGSVEVIQSFIFNLNSFLASGI